MWESVRVRVLMWLSFYILQISKFHKYTRGKVTYHSVPFLHELFVEDYRTRVCFWRSLAAGFGGRNLLLGQRLPELGRPIHRHVSLSECKVVR